MDAFRPVRTRFAPSPTGHLHLGGARTALYDYLLARQNQGQFILRLEDTDRKRYVPGAEEELMDGLRWLGIDWDEGIGAGGPFGPYRQSERKDLYQEYAHKLIASGHAYYCFCTPERLEKMRQRQIKAKESTRYDGTCRRLDPDEAQRRVAAGERHVIRFKTPQQGSITGYDLLRGNITVENNTLDDVILVRSDGLAVYHLSAMVDDQTMKISHVVRGAEWLSTFPLHIHIYNAFGWEQPVWVHLSLFLKPSGKGKMSKRESAELKQDGYSIFIKDLRELGYVPEGVVNWIALMGWSYDDHTEFFTLSDLVEKFSLERLNPAPAAINFSKLDHFNGLHIRSLPVQELAQREKTVFERAGYNVANADMVKVAEATQVRIVTLEDAVPMAGFFFEDEVHPKPEELVGKNLTRKESAAAAQAALDLLSGLEEINPETAEEPMRAKAEELGIPVGTFFGILRVAVTGKTVSPPLFESMAIIGKEKVLERIREAIRVLERMV